MPKLRYTINDWDKLPECLSNNSRDLKIKVSKLLNDELVVGTRIRVEHNVLGTLFTTVIDSKGALIEHDPQTPGHGYNMPKDVILKELKKFGFEIEFSKLIGITKHQIEALKVLSKLNFDKLRRITVISYSNNKQHYNTHIILFNTDKHPELLYEKATISYKYFIKGLSNGSICDISNLTGDSKLSWYWLDFIANIDDVIKEGGIDG